MINQYIFKHPHKKGSKGGHSGSKKRRNHNRKKKGAHKKHSWDIQHGIMAQNKMHVDCENVNKYHIL